MARKKNGTLNAVARNEACASIYPDSTDWRELVPEILVSSWVRYWCLSLRSNHFGRNRRVSRTDFAERMPQLRPDYFPWPPTTASTASSVGHWRLLLAGWYLPDKRPTERRNIAVKPSHLRVNKRIKLKYKRTNLQVVSFASAKDADWRLRIVIDATAKIGNFRSDRAFSKLLAKVGRNFQFPFHISIVQTSQTAHRERLLLNINLLILGASSR